MALPVFFQPKQAKKKPKPQSGEGRARGGMALYIILSRTRKKKGKKFHIHTCGRKERISQKIRVKEVQEKEKNFREWKLFTYHKSK